MMRLDDRHEVPEASRAVAGLERVVEADEVLLLQMLAEWLE